MTFLTFAAQAVFHTLSSAGGSNIRKTLFLDVKSFHRYIKTERGFISTFHSQPLRLAHNM